MYSYSGVVRLTCKCTFSWVGIASSSSCSGRVSFVVDTNTLESTTFPRAFPTECSLTLHHWPLRDEKEYQCYFSLRFSYCSWLSIPFTCTFWESLLHLFWFSFIGILLTPPLLLKTYLYVRVLALYSNVLWEHVLLLAHGHHLVSQLLGDVYLPGVLLVLLFNGF